MEKTLVIILIILSLFVGVCGGAIFTPADVVEKEVTVEKIVNVSVVELVEAPSVLDKAVEAFLISVEDEEDEAGNNVDVLGSYDFDEIEVSRIYDEYNVAYDDDETTVDFSIKLRFDEDGEASEKETFNVTVIFEDDEDTEVTVA